METAQTSVIIVTYNHQEFIEDCLNSVLAHELLEIIIVDNQSTDGTPEYVEANFPGVKVIKTKENIGYGAANNLGVQKAQGKYVVILNPDTKINSLESLIEPLKNNEKLVTIPKVLLYDGKKINTCGNILHFTGMAFTRGAGEDPDNWDESQYVNGLSGVCFAISREEYIKLGGFDENIFLYMEDSEFSWRLNAYGYQILYLPECVVYHSYDFQVPPEKIYYVEKGRYIILRKYLSGNEYVLLSPSFFMTEILTWGYAVLNGPKGIMYKLKGIKDGFKIDLDKVECDRRSLLKDMDYEIPELDFNFNSIFRIFRNLANYTYSNNCRLF